MSGFRSKHGARADRYRHARRGVMFARDGQRQNSKHMRRWRIADDNIGRVYDMRTPVRRVCGGIPTARGELPIESRATAPLPWHIRERNRRRNKAAKSMRRTQTRTATARHAGRRVGKPPKRIKRNKGGRR